MGKRGANKLTKAQGGPNLKSVLRHEHLKNLALWSTAGDTPIPLLATFFGRRLAADGEASDIPHDPDLFSCQRCETALQPGFNCNVRIEKVSANKKKHMRYKKKKPNMFLPQNNVVYYCNFCSHRNLKRGTTKGQMKDMYPPKPKTTRPRPKIDKEMMVLVPQGIQINTLPSSPERRVVNDQVENSSAVENTPKPMLTLEREKRIRKSKSKKPVEPESVPEKKATVGGGSNKRKRKAWTSMKELSETTTTNKSSSSVNFKIPFLL
ncbi:hypothetical protein HID58_061807 [Brassica napus]|uniref:BnaC04g33030D protein n=2 Tax=Brassica napus TaxID=3708 RepID=A0A078IAQ7_BRANA|nr:uncharacterized protein BNAC04G33030D [Brassica napus]KAH0885711.1 hypothetical protein HID58_061807 [Brassica napus]CAF1859490.1 unnamed protein product [Brassica napus]CDY46384.1 BnaC04g33030D [Brassica napus]